MSRLECIAVEADGSGEGQEVVLMEPRPFRPFKSSEEYLVAMKEDLAEWLHRLYSPQLNIDFDNFMDVLEDGVALCKHANNVRRTAMAYKEKLEQQGTHRRRKFSTHLDIPDRDVLFRSEVKPKSFFARDNVHNFIQWCRLLGIYECLLFETDDLVLRKNEKSFILCLLEVARRGANFGMPAPVLVQFEKEIDREMAKEGNMDNDGNDNEYDEEDMELIEYGPRAQIVTNDLRSLDEMVRDLVENCSCPTQFPMIRVSEGKYRIGDTKMLIFVRVLRNHVMVRVGGGWDTLSHYLEKHDPCRCRAGHRTPIASKLSISHNARGAQMEVSYERASSPPGSRRSSGASVSGMLSRKNSSAGMPYSTSDSSSNESPVHRFHARQRSPSPSVRNYSGGSPVFQRSGSGRFSANNSYHHGQTSPSAQHDSYTAVASPQADSTETYESGQRVWNPSYRRSTSLGNTQQTKPIRLTDEQYPTKTSRTKTTNNGTNTDSSSEISDEGYRTGVGLADMKNDELDERPDSSCTQVSQSSSLESGVSSAGPSADDPEPIATNYKKEKTENKYNASKIPFLGSLRAMGKGAYHYSTESNNSSRKSSIDSDRALIHANLTNHSPTHPSTAAFRRDIFGRHSLRARSSASDYERYQAGRSSIDSADQSASSSSTSKNTLTWSGRNRRQRPTILPESTTRNKTPVSSTTGTSYRSRSVNSSTSRGQSRASSTSPSSRRRNVFIGSSMSHSGPSSPEIKVAPHLKYSKPTTYAKQQQQPVSPQPESPKISPLLRNMLKDVELDNDASILKKMEEIVNQYKARVESILAAEGKTLDDDLVCSTNGSLASHQNSVHHTNGHVSEDVLVKINQEPSQLCRRNSLDSRMSQLPTRIYPTPRKDVVSQSPSKIPIPQFYRPKEACL